MIKNVQESDDGTYTCRAVVMQTGELAERNIKLEVCDEQKFRVNDSQNILKIHLIFDCVKLINLQVYTAPEMEDRETTVRIKEGESAAITCKARGKPPPTYTWIKASTREVRL